MIASTAVIGKQRAHRGASGRPLETLEDLRTHLHLAGIPKPLVSSMETALNHAAVFLGAPLEQLSIEAVAELVDSPLEFKAHLQDRKYKPHSVRTYSSALKIAITKAKTFGWSSKRPEVPEWAPIREAVAPRGCCNIVAFAIREGILPSEFSDEHLERWATRRTDSGRSYSTATKMKEQFRREIVKAGIQESLPHLTFVSKRHPNYAIPMAELPSALRTELEALLKWKQADFAPGRPRKCQHRPVTAARLEHTIRRLYGFATKVQPNMTGKADPVTGLSDLVREETVTEFVGYMLNDRKNSGRHAEGDLGLLYAAFRYHPAYKKQDYSWIARLIAQLPKTPDSERLQQKSRKYVPYDVLSEIPSKLQTERHKLSPNEGRQIALLAHDELLMRWLLTMVWRQRNIRECRVGSDPELANLYKAKVTPLVTMAMPNWIQEALAVNPEETFWQIHFREKETKTHHQVRSFLPRQLIQPLEEYLNRHRPGLLQGQTDPGTLFLNRTGGPLNSEEVRGIVGNLTVRFAGRRVTPHIVRDILAYKWLEDHPEDYLTLSKILWHKNIQTTLRIYGQKFDESNGVRRMEEWLDRRNVNK